MTARRIVHVNGLHYAKLEEGGYHSMLLNGLYNPNEELDIYSDSKPGFAVKAVVIEEESQLSWPPTTYVKMLVRK